MTLVEFLTARLDEDEAMATLAGRSGFPTPSYDTEWSYTDALARLMRTGTGPDTAPHIAPHDPARVLREVKAKRAILGLYSEVDGHESSNYAAAEDYMESTVQSLAAVYSDHPDFDESWRP